MHVTTRTIDLRASVSPPGGEGGCTAVLASTAPPARSPMRPALSSSEAGCTGQSFNINRVAHEVGAMSVLCARACVISRAALDVANKFPKQALLLRPRQPLTRCEVANWGSAAERHTVRILTPSCTQGEGDLKTLQRRQNRVERSR